MACWKSLVWAVGAVFVTGLAAAAAPPKLAPLSEDEALSTHGPFEMGECVACHDARDRKRPGKLLKAGAALCFDCHEDFKAPVKGHPRVAATGSCTTCHSPHNSRKRKLLL
jgi:predicted CXXCH cytochrome family protein